MSHLKLMKLLYIAERTSIQENSYPILGDALFSMNKGPMLNLTYDYMKKRESVGDRWSKWVSQIRDNQLSLARRYDPEDLDLLSDAVLEILAGVCNRYGNMGTDELVKHTHDFPEWKYPHGSHKKIEYKDLLIALGYREKSEEVLIVRQRLKSRYSQIWCIRARSSGDLIVWFHLCCFVGCLLDSVFEFHSSLLPFPGSQIRLVFSSSSPRTFPV